MSEADKQATAILLPEARVAIYSKDKETLDSARVVKEDWRFARVLMAIEDGDIHSATEFYRDQPSPDLIIVQTETIDESLTDYLEKLAAQCDEGTAAIVIGPDNDVYLYRKLIEMGVSDYLVKPLKSSVMAEVIAKTLIERLGVTKSRLIAFIGAKGGVGVSALSQGAAWGIADVLGHKTMLLDISGGWSIMNVGLGFEPSATIAEAALAASKKDEDSLSRMLFKASDNLSVLASGADIMLEKTADPDGLEDLLDVLLLKYPILVADLSHSPPELAKIVLSRAHHIVIVSTPCLTALRLARTLSQEIKEIRGGEGEDIDLIINMQGLDKTGEVPKGDIEQAMEMKVRSIIPFAEKVFSKTESAGKNLLSDKDGQNIVHQHLLPVVGKTLSGFSSAAPDKSSDSTGLLGSVLGKLKSK